MLRTWLSVSVLAIVGMSGTGNGSAIQAADEPKPISYDEHIAPIFKRQCWNCHGDSKQEAGLNLASYAGALKGGSGGAVLTSGRSTASRLFKAITAEDPAERMPPNSDPLPPEQVVLIKKWIESGLRQAPNSAVVPDTRPRFTPLAAGATNGPVVLPENLPAVEPTKTHRPFPVLALASSPRAPVIAVAAYERVDLMHAETGKPLGSLAFPEGEPQVLRFSRSGAVLLIAGGRPVQNGVVVLFDVKTGKRLAVLGDEADTVLAADLSTDEQTVALGGSSRLIKLVATTTGAVRHTLVKHTDWITALAYSPDGKLLASADRVGNIHLWDGQSGGVVLPLSEHKSSVRALAWRSDSQVLASCGEDGQIIWWEIAKGWPAISKSDAHPPRRAPGTFGKVANGVLDLHFNAKGELATCGRDGQLRCWTADGTERLVFKSDPLMPDMPQTRSTRPLPLRVVWSHNGQSVHWGDSDGRMHSRRGE